MSCIEIAPAAGPLNGQIRPPGSKSITNRALLCAAAATGESELTGVLESEDTHVMIEALSELGVGVERLLDVGSATDLCRFRVKGIASAFRPCDKTIFVANSGTTVRFLTAMLAIAGGDYRLDGVARMRERPIEDLLIALRGLGADASAENGNGCPPVVLHSERSCGGAVSVKGDISSQYLSGLLMAAPLALEGVQLDVVGELVSKPYVEMTLAVMAEFGVSAEQPSSSRFRVPAPQSYQARQYAIEPDASAASYFWAAAAVVGGSVTVKGLSRHSLQGDVGFCECLEQMGCHVEYGRDGITLSRSGPLVGIDVNMNAISDTVQTIAAVALFAEGPTTIRGVAHNRHKETDRIGDLARELRKLGAQVTEHEDGMTIEPGERMSAEIETYDDHRMAMSLSLVGLRTPGVVIRDPDCTRKTYPNFFDDFRRLTR